MPSGLSAFGLIVFKRDAVKLSELCGSGVRIWTEEDKAGQWRHRRLSDFAQNTSFFVEVTLDRYVL
jgi:hypothetical protein